VPTTVPSIADLRQQLNNNNTPSLTAQQQPSHQLQTHLSQLDYLRAQLQAQAIPTLGQDSPSSSSNDQLQFPSVPKSILKANPSTDPQANGGGVSGNATFANSSSVVPRGVEEYSALLERLRAMSQGQCSLPPTPTPTQPVHLSQQQQSPLSPIQFPSSSSSSSSMFSDPNILAQPNNILQQQPHLVIPQSLATPEQVQHLKYLAQWKLLDCQQQLLQQQQQQQHQDSFPSPFLSPEILNNDNNNLGLPSSPEYALAQFHQQLQLARLEAEREKERELKKLEAETARFEAERELARLDRLQEHLQAQLVEQQKQEALRQQLLNFQQQQQQPQQMLQASLLPIVNNNSNPVNSLSANSVAVSNNASVPSIGEPNPLTNPFLVAAKAQSQPLPSVNSNNNNSMTPTTDSPPANVFPSTTSPVNPFAERSKEAISEFNSSASEYGAGNLNNIKLEQKSKQISAAESSNNNSNNTTSSNNNNNSNLSSTSNANSNMTNHQLPIASSSTPKPIVSSAHSSAFASNNNNNSNNNRPNNEAIQPPPNDANLQMQKSSMSRLAGMVKNKPQAPQTLNNNNNSNSNPGGNNNIANPNSALLPNNSAIPISSSVSNANNGKKEIVPWPSSREVLAFITRYAFVHTFTYIYILIY
jgi:hypothetical protein